MSAIETRLAELGVTLPVAPAPAANYVPFVVQGNTVYVSGQISNDANGFITGTLGQDMDTAAGAAAAKTCAISSISGMAQGTIFLVSPGVIRTHDRAGDITLTLQQFVRTVTTDVVKGT